MRKQNLTIICLALTAVMLIFLVNCSKEKESEKSTIRKNTVKFLVTSEEAVSGKITEYIDYAGTARSSNTLVVIPVVSGKIVRMYKEIGDEAERGDTLFKLEDTLYKALYIRAKAQLASSRISLKDAEKNKKRIQAVYKKKGISDSR